jgi:hypothetical protein
MSTDDTHGWFGGGAPALATVDRIDFSNDTGTANIRGTLSAARGYLAATGNSNYGWFGGGFPGPISTVDRIDFSNDFALTSTRSPLSIARSFLSSTGNTNYGWFGGGFSTPSTSSAVSIVDRIDFSNDSSTASPRGALSSVRSGLTATGNPNYGWFGGGFPALSTVDRIDFSNDSASVSVRGPLSAGKGYTGATGNSNYGWWGGGNDPALPIPQRRLLTVDRIDFSNDSVTASVRGPLSLARAYLAATGNSNYGWFGGGTPAATSTIDRIDFANDSVTASIRGPLSSVRPGPAATSGQAKGPAIRPAKTGGYGWFGGGAGGSPTASVSIVDRIDFSNDLSTASPRGSLINSPARFALTATGNSNYGWFGGGTSIFPSPVFSIVDRIDFSNDLSTASPRGPLSSARKALAATGNSNYGWFGGGQLPTATATVDRIDFSNDSVRASVRGPLSASKYDLSATGNSNYGWFGAAGPAIPFVLTVDRIDFSNDGAQALIRGPLTTGKNQAAATGNSNYGWFSGGNPFPVSTVDRINFANDSVAASPRGTLTARQNMAATANSNYGWFGGGRNPPATATVERIDFSNDSVSASPRGSLSAGRYYLAATSNTST